jgi:glycosyltransferase involved in cell wall biosynthesis
MLENVEGSTRHLTRQHPRIVVVVEHYLPGFQAGGPMRSVSALVDQLRNEIDFYVLTRDRDAGCTAAYSDIRAGKWSAMVGGHVRYLTPQETGAASLVGVVREVQPHAIHLNGIFAPMSVQLLLARRLGALKGVPIVLAPRGELSPGALTLKGFKKRSFLRFCHWTALHDDVVFHASTERERDEISQAISFCPTPIIARDPIGAVTAGDRRRSKTAGRARFVFLSRISRKKNLHIAIDQLRSVTGSVEFDIYGPVLDAADRVYWRECKAMIATMPPNVTVTYRGPVAHDRVASTLSTQEFFLFPTASENFGHAIVEAFLAGCPVITSDQTPWLGLARHGAGWDLPLDDTDAWQRTLQTCIDMDGAAFEQASACARSLGKQIASADAAAENLQLFRSMVDGPSPSGTSHTLEAATSMESQCERL